MRLIRGAAGTGKTALVFREITAALRAGTASARIVVPTSTLVRHYQHQLARTGLVFAPATIVSLSRFICEAAPELEPAPDGFLRATVRDCLQRLRLPEFADVSGTEGMVATVIETLSLFENASATPEKLAATGRKVANARSFSRLWDAISEAVRNAGFSTRADLIRAAIAAPRRDPPPALWLDGFLAFSPLEKELLRALAASTDLTLTLPDMPAADDLRRFAMSLGAKDELLHNTPRKPSVSIIEARSVEREADEIARQITELNRAGMPFRQIGIALREPGTYLPLLNATLHRFGIPVRSYFASPLQVHPVATFLNGLVNCVLNGWDFETALETFRAHPKWGTRAAFDRFDFAVREAMPGSGADSFLSLCIDETLKAGLAECTAADRWATAIHTPLEWSRRFERMATRTYRMGFVDMGVFDSPRDHASVALARTHVSALSTWIASVHSATRFWPDPSARLTLADYWAVVSTAIETAVFRVADDRSNVVHLMSAHEARQWDLSALFVCGMLDREYPKRHSQNLLFPDSDIDQLRRAGIPVRRASELADDEGALFEALKTRATEVLFLTYPRRDTGGRGAQVSQFFEQFQQSPVPAVDCRPAAVAAPPPGRAGCIQASALQSELAVTHRRISLSALEDLAQCRFKFFAGRALFLRGAPDTPGERLQPRLTGLILHEALEMWLGDMNQDFVALFEKAFDAACIKHHLPQGYRLEVERIKFREIAQRISATKQWHPDSSEAEAAFTLDFPGGVAVTCRVDRIDRFGNDCVIVDYKSSKTENVRKLPYSRTKLQGPIYALAVREQRALNPIAVLFWAVRDDERFGWGRIPGSDEEFIPIPANWMEDARDRIVTRLGDYLTGSVHAQPEESEACRWCDYASACRVELQPAVITIQTTATSTPGAAGE